MDLEQEASRATEMLKGKTVKIVQRHRDKEIAITFDDNTRLYVDSSSPLELSVLLNTEE